MHGSVEIGTWICGRTEHTRRTRSSRLHYPFSAALFPADRNIKLNARPWVGPLWVGHENFGKKGVTRKEMPAACRMPPSRV